MRTLINKMFTETFTVKTTLKKTITKGIKGPWWDRNKIKYGVKLLRYIEQI
jgi:hypothetical protein